MLRTFILSFLFIAFCSHLQAQNWKTVALHDTTYFSGGICERTTYPNTTDSNLLRVIWIASAQANSADSTFYFYTTLRLPHANTQGCIDTASASWLGKKFVRTNSGTEYYFNSHNDTITVHTHAGIGISWLLGRSTNGVIYTATIASVGVTTIDGTTDSIKTAVIQASQNSSPVASHYNGMRLQWSKAHGWTQTLDFYNFPNGDSLNNAIGTVSDSAQHYRLPKLINSIDLNNIDLAWKYAPGNEWIVAHETGPGLPAANNRSYIHDSVINMSIIAPNTAKVTFKTRKYELKHIGPTMYDVQITTATTIHTDTIAVNQAPIIVKQNILPEFKQYAMNDYLSSSNTSTVFWRSFIESFCDGKYVFKKRQLVSGYGWGNTGPCWSVLPGVSGYSLRDTDRVSGFGVTYLRWEEGDIGIGIPVFVDISNYTYLKLASCTRGTKIDVIALGVGKEMTTENIDLNIYPNPATDVVTITIAQPLQHAYISVSDITGRNVLKQTFEGTTTTLQTSGLSDGIYIVNIASSTGTWTRKLVVGK